MGEFYGGEASTGPLPNEMSHDWISVMLTSEELIELKYQDVLGYQEIVTNAAINSNVTSAANPQIGCLFTAIITSLLMGFCAMVFMPSPKRKN